MADTLLAPTLVYRLGRTRTWHRARVLIEGEPKRVVVRTACGIRFADGDWTETMGFLSCADCEAAG